MSGNDNDYLQNLMDENYVMLKDLKEQQQRFSVNYERQLDSIKDQHTKLAKTLNQQQEINSSLKDQVDKVSLAVKVGFGGFIFGVIGLLVSGGIWWHAHHLYAANDKAVQLLLSYRAKIPIVDFKDGKEYIKIDPDTETTSFVDSDGNAKDGTFAAIRHEDL